MTDSCFPMASPWAKTPNQEGLGGASYRAEPVVVSQPGTRCQQEEAQGQTPPTFPRHPAQVGGISGGFTVFVLQLQRWEKKINPLSANKSEWNGARSRWQHPCGASTHHARVFPTSVLLVLL